MLAAAALVLTACSLLQEDGGQKSIRINLPPIVSASGNSRSISADRLPTLKTETRRYRVTVNGMVREGTESSYEFTLPVGIRATVTVEGLNSSGEVIIRAVKDFTVAGGDNIIDINLKADGTEIIPASAAGRVTYSYGEADRHGGKNGIPSDPTTYSEGDLFEVKDGSGMTWDHASQQSGFTGWSASPAIESENGGQATNAPISGQKYKMPKGGVTLTAQWNKRQYSITYQTNEANSGGTPTGSVPGTSSVEALASANISSDTPPQVSTGSVTYSFTGWNTQAGGGGTTYRAGQQITMMTEDITLYAQWTSANVYTVTYNIGSGNVPQTSATTGWRASDPYIEGTSSAITLPTLSATGYTFGGWQITGESNNRGGGTSYTPTGNVTATAQWTINSYQVTYVLDGGNGGPASGNVQYNTSIALDAPTKTGYTFTGWSDGGTTYGGTSGNNSLSMPAQAITLTALWTINSYQVTYALDGGSGGPASGNVQYNASVALDAPTKTGYTFAGWSDGSTTYGGTSGNNSLNMPAQAITLTAVWTPITYTITYDANGGGTNPGNTTFTVADSSVTFASFNTLAKTGYTCMGWETTDGTDVANMFMPTEIINLMGSGTTLALRAKWEVNYKSDKANWEVGDIVLNNSSGTVLAIHPDVYTARDQSTYGDGVAVVYKNDSTNSKVYIVGKVQACKEWCLDSANGYNKINALVTEMDNDTAGQLTFKSGTYTDGSTGLAVIQALGDYNQTNYPAWYWANNYGSTQSLTGDLENNWYLPSLAEVFDIWKVKASVEDSLAKVDGDTFDPDEFYGSSSQDASNDGSVYNLDLGNGEKRTFEKDAGINWYAVRQFTY